MMINGAVEVITASIVAGLTQHAALHPLDTLKVRLQYSKGVPMSTSVRGALGDALRHVTAQVKVACAERGELLETIGHRFDAVFSAFADERERELRGARDEMQARLDAVAALVAGSVLARRHAGGWGRCGRRHDLEAKICLWFG